MTDETLSIAGVTFDSRLIVGTGKYPDHATMHEAVRASRTEMVTIAVGRIDLDDPEAETPVDVLADEDLRLLPNTAGAHSVDEALQLARLARAAGLSDWIKLEVIADDDLLWPDPAGTVEATRILTEEGFKVLPYTSPDPVVAVAVEEAGAVTVMPLGSPIGSGNGVLEVDRLRMIRERVSVPVVVDAGIGVPSDAATAMEHGADAVLVNTAIAKAEDPVLMAEAMRRGVIAGRQAFTAGRIPRQPLAQASTDQDPDFVDSIAGD